MPLADLVLAVVTLIEIASAMVAVGVAYKVAALVGHAPLGWILLTGGFVVILFTRFIFLAEFLIAPVPADLTTFIGQALGLPAFALVLSGVYYLYRDMRTQMTLRQSEILASGAEDQR